MGEKRSLFCVLPAAHSGPCQPENPDLPMMKSHDTEAALRAEVESLRAENAALLELFEAVAAAGQPMADEIASLQAQLAHQQTLFVLAERVVTNAESELAAVRTDLSVARAALEEIASIRLNTKPMFLARRALGLADEWDAGLAATPPVGQR